MYKDKKAWWQSKTIWGAFVTLAATVVGLFGYQIGPEQQAQATEAFTQIAAAAGAILAIYGRLTATQRIK